jgi:hypothetical protein
LSARALSFPKTSSALDWPSGVQLLDSFGKLKSLAGLAPVQGMVPVDLSDMIRIASDIEQCDISQGDPPR